MLKACRGYAVALSCHPISIALWPRFHGMHTCLKIEKKVGVACPGLQQRGMLWCCP